LNPSTRPLDIALDMTLLQGRLGGSTVYAEELLRALGKRDDVRVQVISAHQSGVSTAKWMLSSARSRALEVRAAVLHCPAFLAPFNPPIPLVLTIHDLSLGRMPSGHPFEWRMFYRLLLPRLVRKAAFIIVPTEATRKDVVSSFGIAPERVVSMPYGVDERFSGFTSPDKLASTLRPLMVFPGPPIGRKNLDVVLTALAKAAEGSELSKVQLEITGAVAADFPKYADRISQLGLSQRVTWLGRLPHEDIPAVYARADVLAYPSFLEGFGFPPLEAMAVGTPVVSSNASCLPEVLGDAALLVDPHDDAAFGAAVESVLTSTDLRNRLVTAGKARARLFTWKQCADMTAEVYRRAAEMGEGALVRAPFED
jgi:glycosyltransferase involved in cell wall biosynthesis